MSRQEIKIVERVWGIEHWALNDPILNICGKRMVMNGSGSSRIERHRMKDETFFVLSGVVRLELFGYGAEPEPEEIVMLRSGEGYRIRPLHWHRFSAAEADTTFFEVSTFHSDLDAERREVRRSEL